MQKEQSSFIVNSTLLSKAVQMVARAVPSKSMLPIIENVLFVTSDNELTLSATNLEISVVTKIPIEFRGENISLAFSPKLIVDVLKAIPEQPITFAFTENMVEIATMSGKYKMSGESGENFPLIQSFENLPCIEIPTDILLNGIDRTLFAASTDEDRAALNGMSLEIGKDFLRFVCTDAHRLVKAVYSVSNEVEKTMQFVVPQKGVAMIKSCLSQAQTKLYFSENNLFAEIGDTIVVVRLCDQRFPGYENVIPKEHVFSIKIEKDSFIKALKRANIFANKISHQVKLAIIENGMSISAEDLDYCNEAKEDLRCETTNLNELFEIGFNGAYLIEVLNNIAGVEVEMFLSVPNRAVVIKSEVENSENDSVLSLIMPIMLNN